ncbi:hypothetical protein GGR52DRAFT_568881 [Hypoxylon sp. FL1284]|nr:hypothetical protein GGR52DRAFT_568881 [Hypoxylon sp. FL1284]
MPARAVPCQRCLDAASKWKEGNSPHCEDDGSASSKCGRCRQSNEVCVVASGMVKARAIQLQSALNESHDTLTDKVREAQTGVRKALRNNKNRKGMNTVRLAEQNRTEASEHAENRAQFHERVVAALERKAAAGERAATAQEASFKRLADLENTLSPLPLFRTP